MPNDKIAKYGASEHGNFTVIDTIGVPHPYCIGAKHVVHASDRFGGMLGEAAIESAEKHGIVCETCRGRLTFKQHESALLISCKVSLDDEQRKPHSELHNFLTKCKPLCEADGFVGFAFKDDSKRSGR